MSGTVTVIGSAEDATAAVGRVLGPSEWKHIDQFEGSEKPAAVADTIARIIF